MAKNKFNFKNIFQSKKINKKQDKTLNEIDDLNYDDDDTLFNEDKREKKVKKDSLFKTSSKTPKVKGKIKLSRLITPIILLGIVILMLYKALNLININNEIENNNIEYNEIISKIEIQKNLIKKENDKEKSVGDVSIYENNINVYLMLANIKASIEKKASKYQNYTLFEIKYDNDKNMTQNKLEEFIVSLSFLGFIEKIEGDIVFLHIENKDNNLLREDLLRVKSFR